MSLETIDRSLFAVISAPADLSGLPLWLATLAAKGSIFVLAALVIWTWRLARPGERRALERLILAVPLALALNYVIGLAYPHPRPFMIGLSRNFLGHSSECSFPSDHAFAMWTVAFDMLIWSRAKWAGGLAIVLVALTSWARVFLGVHFPFDILGSMAVAMVAVAVVAAVVAWLPESADGSLATLWPADRCTPARAANPRFSPSTPPAPTAAPTCAADSWKKTAASNAPCTRAASTCAQAVRCALCAPLTQDLSVHAVRVDGGQVLVRLNAADCG